MLQKQENYFQCDISCVILTVQYSSAWQIYCCVSASIIAQSNNSPFDIKRKQPDVVTKNRINQPSWANTALHYSAVVEQTPGELNREWIWEL